MGFFVSVTVSERDARRTFPIDAEFKLRWVFLAAPREKLEQWVKA